MARNNTSGSMDDGDESDVSIEIKEKAKLPPEVVQAFGGFGLPSVFTATLYKYQNGNKSPAIEGSWEDYCPSLDEIGNQYGSGRYRLHVDYENERHEKDKKSINFSLGSGYDEGFVKNQRIKRAIETGNGGNSEDSLDRELNRMLKFKELTSSGGSGDMASVMAGFMGVMGTMFQQMNAQNQQMLQLVLGQKKDEPSTLDRIKEFAMLRDVIGPAGEKEQTMTEKLVDAGIEVFKTMAPEIVNKLNNPLLAGMTQRKLAANPHFQEMKSNPESKAKLIEYVKKTFPARQAEKAIEKAGLNDS